MLIIVLYLFNIFYENLNKKMIIFNISAIFEINFENFFPRPLKHKFVYNICKVFHFVNNLMECKRFVIIFVNFENWNLISKIF